MEKENLKHYWQLVVILGLGLGLFLLFDYNRQIQVGVVLAMAAAYVFWGMQSHRIRKGTAVRLFLEYLVVAALASLAIIILLLRR